MKFPKESNEWFMVDILDECVDDKISDGYFSNPLENNIVNSACVEMLNSLEYLYLLDSSPHFYWSKYQFEALEIPTSENT